MVFPKKSLWFLLLLSAGLIVSFCHPTKTAQSYSADELQKYFLTGQRYLNKNELVQAEVEFRKALQFNKHFVPALVGMAQIAIKKNDLILAESWLEKVPKNNAHAFLVNLTRAQLDYLNGEYEKSLNRLLPLETTSKKLALDSLLNVVVLLKLQNLMQLQRWQEVQQLWQQFADIENNQSTTFQRPLLQAKQLHKLITATPPQCQSFLLKKVITREEMVFLIMHCFKNLAEVPKTLWQFDPMANDSEIVDLPFDKNKKELIKRVLQKHLMWAYPDKRFYPRDYVTFGELLIVLQRLWASLHPNSQQYDKHANLVSPLNQALTFAKSRAIFPLKKPIDFQKKVSGLTVIRAFLQLRD